MYIAVRAGLLVATAIWALSIPAAHAGDLQGPPAAAAAGNVQVAQAEQRTAEVAQFFGAEHVTVNARRVDEDIQKVPLAVSVVDSGRIADTGAYNLNRLTQLQPSLQFYSSNPRNSSVNIRGIGAPLGLTNDG